MGLVNLANSEEMDFKMLDKPKSIEKMKEWLKDPNIKDFCKQRKVFVNTEKMINDIEIFSLEDLQNTYNQVLQSLKSRSANVEDSIPIEAKFTRVEKYHAPVKETNDITETLTKSDVPKETNVITRVEHVPGETIHTVEKITDISWLINMLSSDNMKKLFNQFVEYYAKVNGFDQILVIANNAFDVLSKEKDFNNDYNTCVDAIAKLINSFRMNLNNLTDAQLQA